MLPNNCDIIGNSLRRKAVSPFEGRSVVDHVQRTYVAGECVFERER